MPASNNFSTIATAVAQLKNFYQGPIQDQMSDDLALWRAAEKSKRKWSGLKVVQPLKTRRHSGIGATSDNGALPLIGKTTEVQAEILAKYNYLRFGISAPMIKASQNDMGSFVRSAAYQLEEGYKDLASDLNRQSGWDGSGTLAKVNANATASTTLVIKGRETTDPALKFVDIGMAVDIYRAGVLVVGNIGVANITAGTPTGATATLTLSDAVTVLADDVIVRAGSFGMEVQGILTTLDGGTSTVYNVNRLENISYQGNYSNVVGALTEQEIQEILDEADRRGGSADGFVDALYSDHVSRRWYQKILRADKRFVGDVKGDGGFANKNKSFLSFNGIPWVADKDAPHRIIAMNSKQFEKMVLCDMEFADETGSMMIAQANADAFEVRIRLFANFFNKKPSAFGVLTGYTEPA